MSNFVYMDKSFIKTQLLEFCNEFKKHAGTFYSYQIVHNYISFISSDKSIAIFLLPMIDNLGPEIGSWKDSDLQELKDIQITADNLEGLKNIPYFKDVFSSWEDDFTNKGVFKPEKALPIYFSFLSIMAHKIEKINEYQKNNQIKEAEMIIEEIKEESFSFIQNPVDNKQTLSYSKFATISMEMVNKYIIDEIDSQMLLNNKKPKISLSFDSGKSILNFYGEEIKITLKSRPPVEHYILKAIFDNDLNKSVSFYDIAECENDEYRNNWNRYRNACDKLNVKISKQTKNKINDFIDYKTGIDGWCKINKKYL
jgi:hypothetical protein